MNNSFASVIKNFIQVFGTIMLLFILNWRLSLIVLVSYFAMFSYIRYSGKRSKLYYSRQQKSLGELDGYVQEMMAGAKVVKVFSREKTILAYLIWRHMFCCSLFRHLRPC